MVTRLLEDLVERRIRDTPENTVSCLAKDEKVSEHMYLLIHVTIGRTPAMNSIVAACAINGRLRIDSQEAKFIQLRELRGNDCRL